MYIIKSCAKQNQTVKDISLVSGSVISIALLSQIIIPFKPVPVTGQTLGILLSAGLLGKKKGMLSVLTYILLGTMGIPLFAGGDFGLARLAGPTGGYLTGFLAAAFVVGTLKDKGFMSNFRNAALCMMAGNIVIYTFGLLWLSKFMMPTDLLTTGVYPFIPGDIIKIIIAASLIPAGKRFIK